MKIASKAALWPFIGCKNMSCKGLPWSDPKPVTTPNRLQDTEAFREVYRIRSGGESLFSGAKSKLGLDRLRVRGSPAVSYKIWMKLVGWNVLRAAASERLRQKLDKKAEKRGQSGRNTAFGTGAIRVMATAWAIWHFQRFHGTNRARKRSVAPGFHSGSSPRKAAA
ncbi:hypothetical protein AKJ51_04895 [candidate division MSBL1 archaeon SCGC-AAA382A20]|uniref:Transposase DDE domain-containing protein n=1 Tax=candidate division MSBL1 archaeon SCGC-AAA382A20 TaxID=1698280 RepID=A0A133VGW4_9EURY|nr:hypothetical protein AKJ51_04895 [candidate division MSBL1 archaeon SCGC-AAA382A20]